MNWTLVGLIVLAVFMIAAPFVALRTISSVRARRGAIRARPPRNEKDDTDKHTGFW
jgi:hypothetical protein